VDTIVTELVPVEQTNILSKNVLLIAGSLLKVGLSVIMD